jgi:hypothetical protein
MYMMSFCITLRAKRKLDELVGLHRRLLSAWPDILRLPHGYAWRWFGWHCIEAGEPGKLVRALLDLDYLTNRLEATDLGSLLTDCDRATGAADEKRQSLALVREALEKSAHVLLTAPRQLANQFYGRLRAGASAEIDALLQQAGAAMTKQELVPLIQNLQPVGSALRRTLRGHEACVNGALALADGRLLSWSKDGTLRLWASNGARSWNCAGMRIGSMAPWRLRTGGCSRGRMTGPCGSGIRPLESRWPRSISTPRRQSSLRSRPSASLSGTLWEACTGSALVLERPRKPQLASKRFKRLCFKWIRPELSSATHDFHSPLGRTRRSELRQTRAAASCRTPK